MNFNTMIPPLVAAFGLSACMGGGSSNPQPVSRDLSGPAALNAGSVEGEGSANGLPFAGAAEDFPGEITLQFAHLVINDTGEASVAITENTVILTESNQLLLLNGEVLEFAPAGDFFRATAADGTVYNLSTRELGDENVQTINIDILESPTDPAITFSASRSVIGQQTDPALLPAILPDGGSVLYAGLADIAYTVADLDGTNAADPGTAQMVLNVNVRSSGLVSGSLRSLDSTQFQVNNEDFNLEMSLAQTNLVGNGFGTTASRTNCEPGACPGNSQIGGALYGENAENIGGVIVLDETLVSEDVRLLGAGNYNFFRPDRLDPP